MNEQTNAQLQMVAHDCELHAVLLMDLLRLVHWIDPLAFGLQVDQAERELRAAESDPTGPLCGPGSHRVLKQRVAFLRSVQIGSSAPG